jgi:hypothetical protein
MMMQWLRDYLIYKGEQTFENYTEFTHYIVVGQKKELAQKVRFISDNHVKHMNNMIAKYKFVINQRFKKVLFNYEEIINYVNEKKRPVLIGTMETSAGHIVVFDGQFQNPYGNPSRNINEFSCKYESVNGANLDYSKEFAESMVFREMIEIDTGKKHPNGKKITIHKTSKTNVRRTCWIIEEI